jgi:hypothetical protein
MRSEMSDAKRSGFNLWLGGCALAHLTTPE